MGDVRGGARGLEGHDKPFFFIISIDGDEILRVPLGGKQGNDLGIARPAAPSRMRGTRMQARAHVTAGPHKVGFGFLKTPGGAAGTQENIQPASRASIGVFEPFGAPKLSTCSSADRSIQQGRAIRQSSTDLFLHACARKRRNSLRPEDLVQRGAQGLYAVRLQRWSFAELMSFYERGRRGSSFEKGIQLALPRILAGPEFIFRSHPQPANLPAGARYQISDAELASRLALFLGAFRTTNSC